MFTAKINVYLKKSVADPQGQTIQHSLGHLGYTSVSDVRAGKYFELRLKDVSDEQKAREEVSAMCEKLLVNPVMEDYTFDLVRQD